MLGLEESLLFESVRAELRAIRTRMTRDAVRLGVLQRASVMLGTGASARDVQFVLSTATRLRADTARPRLLFRRRPPG